MRGPCGCPPALRNSCFFAGLVLRRQLLLMLHHRVWELQERGEPLPKHVRHEFLDVTRTSDRTLRPGALGLSEADKQRTIDLRPFMDPCPIVVNELMPLRRVYKLFNTIGLRHLTVVDCREQVVGIVTRKDVLPEIIDERVEELNKLRESHPPRTVIAPEDAKPDSPSGGAVILKAESSAESSGSQRRGAVP